MKETLYLGRRATYLNTEEETHFILLGGEEGSPFLFGWLVILFFPLLSSV